MSREIDFTPEDLIPIGNDCHVRRYIIDGEWLYNMDDLITFFKGDQHFYSNWVSSIYQKMGEKAYKSKIKVVVIDKKSQRVLNAPGVFRLVQGMKGKRADALKDWLSQIAVERLSEELDPSLAVERAIKSWYSKGRTDAWVMERLRSIKVRKAFTDEMHNHGANNVDYAILTNIVHVGTFGISVQDHHKLKNLEPKKSELREEMTTTELLLLALGEHTSTIVAKSNHVKNLDTARSACKSGGKVAGETRKLIEAEVGRSVVTSERASDENSPRLENIQRP